MLPKRFRLPLTNQKGELKKIYSSPYFLLKSKDNNEGSNRFAVIIPASAVKKSTRRHFWKRRMIEYLKLWPNLQKDFLVIVSSKIEKIDKKILRNELDKAVGFLISYLDHRPAADVAKS